MDVEPRSESSADAFLSPLESSPPDDVRSQALFLPFAPAPTFPRPLKALAVVGVCTCFGMVPVVAHFPGPEWAAVITALSIAGSVLAQGCLLATWLAWGDGPFGQRFLRHWTVAGGLYGVWGMGLTLATPQDDDARLMPVVVGLAVPLVSIAAQLPLWTVRHFLGWRLVRGDELASGQPDRPLAIRDLLAATLVVGVSLTAGRLIPIGDAGPWPPLAAGCTVACFISGVTMLPAGILLLRPREFPSGVLWACLYAAGWIGLMWTIIGLLRWFAPGGVGPPPLAACVGVTCWMLTYSGTLILAAAAARSLGYRLARRRRVWSGV